jgi:DNA-binding helix-hairpin-helix protein with protein kinase domain/Tfp pilus assembly protein PilF
MSRIPGASQSEAIRPVHRIFHTSQSDIVRLGRRIGTGAEGEVYEIQDKSDLVAKVYHEPPPAEKAEKLVVLSRLGNERLFNISAWPVSTLRDAPNGEVVGFVMKKISQAEEVHALHSPKSRLQKFPEASWTFLIYVAANIARAVAAIHEHGLVIGDVNPKNILVTRKATVYLLDVDSFQVSAEGKTYRCEGGFPEYTPPELQGVAFRDVDRAQEHDCFGLAVVIFQLLFMGRHPFSGRYLGAGEMPLERAIREYRFAYGVDAEARKMRQPPGTLALESMPSLFVELFRRAFLSADRPRAREWIEPLEALAKALKKCDLHSGHYYYQELRDCPWCGIETHARVHLFNFLLPRDDSRRGHFRLDEVWKEIVSVDTPDAPLIQMRLDEIWAAPTPSAKIAAYERNRLNCCIAALVFSTFAGLTIPVLVGFPFASFLFILAGIAACAIGKTGRTVTLESLYHSRQQVADDHLLEEIKARWRHAEDAAQRLKEQYYREAGNERWGAKRDELRYQKESYENLAQIRQFRFQQLEAEARKNQLDEFLDQFNINDAEIRGVVTPIKAALLSHGVETAANVVEEVKQIQSVGRSQAERLLEWRRGLEQKFVFDPDKGVSPEVRFKTERDVDALRFRLESELSGGAHYLRRIKHDIETSREKLQPALTQACQELAQAKKDLDVARKRNSPALILIALLIAFFIGAAMIPHLPTRRIVGQPPNATKPDHGALADQKMMQSAMALYSEGERLSSEGKLEEAVVAFREAVRIDPNFYRAHKELGFTLYRLGRYLESTVSSKAAINLRKDFDPYYNMGLAYMALGNWGDAKIAFEFAISHIDKYSWSERSTLAYYYLGASMVQLGEAYSAIASLEDSLKDYPNLTVERLELGSLYLLVGNREAASAQYEKLKHIDPALAEELMKLMKKRGKPA